MHFAVGKTGTVPGEARENRSTSSFNIFVDITDKELNSMKPPYVKAFEEPTPVDFYRGAEDQALALC